MQTKQSNMYRGKKKRKRKGLMYCFLAFAPLSLQLCSSRQTKEIKLWCLLTFSHNTDKKTTHSKAQLKFCFPSPCTALTTTSSPWRIEEKKLHLLSFHITKTKEREKKKTGERCYYFWFLALIFPSLLPAAADTRPREECKCFCRTCCFPRR